MASIGDRLLEELRADLDAALAVLEQSAGPVRVLAERVVTTGADVLAAELSGEDVEVAQRALRAAYRDLAAITAQTVADSVLELVRTAVLRVAETAVTALRVL